MIYALDTNTLICFFRGQGRVGERLLATPPSQVCIPTVVVFEINAGLERLRDPERRRRQFDELLSVTVTLPFDTDSARAAAEIRAGLEGAGTPIGPFDTLIAGTALAHGADLVTRNEREFSRAAGLRVHNWYE